MILLTSTSDKLQLITGSAGTIDVHTSYVDLSSGTVTTGRLNSHITSATTTDIVAAPAGSTSRNVKIVRVNNSDASVTNTVTLQHTDGTTVIPLEKVSLAPQEGLSYIEGQGFVINDSVGRIKSSPGSGFPGSANTSDVVATSADTYLQGSSLAGISSRVQVGSIFRWLMRVTKTGAGVAAPTLIIRTGTAGTVSDTARATHTGAAQTGVTDTGWIELVATLSAVGASAVIRSHCDMRHTSADAAGLGTFHTQVNSSTFDITPSGTIIGVSANPGASGVWTFQLVMVEAYNLSN